jgi:hypothetical protein
MSFCPDAGRCPQALGLILATTMALTACSGSDPSTPPVQIVSNNPPAPGPPSSPGGDTTKPTVSITGPSSGAVVSGTRSLTASASDNIGVAGVQFRVNGVNTGAEDTSSPYTISYNTTQVANGAYTLTAAARDAAGNTTTSAAITVTVSNSAPAPADTSAPSVPSGLTATAASSFQINLAWSAATDNIGVTGYRIYRNGAEIGTTTQRSYSATGLNAQSSYTFQVAAFDAENNTSAKSVGASATTLAATVGTSISDLAARLKPGEWGRLDTLGFDGGNILITPEGGSILEYTNELSWDPTRRLLNLAGAARGSGGYGPINQRWIQYSEATNSWSAKPELPFWMGAHMYDHAALDSLTGDYYIRKTDTDQVWRIEPNGSSWLQITSLPVSNPYGIAPLEYFPELGGIVFVGGAETMGDSRFYLYQRGAGAWEQLDASAVTMGLYHSVAEYDPVHRVLYFGGGAGQDGDTRDFYLLDANKNIKRLANAPFTYAVQNVISVVDPVTGNLLFFSDRQPNSFFEYQYNSNTWIERQLSSSFRTTDGYGNQSAVGTALPEYGVLLFVHLRDGVWLYKHSSQ